MSQTDLLKRFEVQYSNSLPRSNRNYDNLCGYILNIKLIYKLRLIVCGMLHASVLGPTHSFNNATMQN